MTAVIMNIPMPARRSLSNEGRTKYDLGSLTPESNECIVIDDVVNVKKAVSRLTSAVGAYRKRGNLSHRFAVRSFKKEDGNDAVGVWRLADRDPVENDTVEND